MEVLMHMMVLKSSDQQNSKSRDGGSSNELQGRPEVSNMFKLMSRG